MNFGNSTLHFPLSAMTCPFAMTMSALKSFKSFTSTISAQRPGAIMPISLLRPKCSAVLIVIIWIAVTGFEPLLDGMAQDAVHVAVVRDRLGVRVVGHEDEAARVQAKLCDRAHL